MICCAFCAGEEPEPVNLTVAPAAIRGLGPPALPPSGACLARDLRMPAGLVTRSRVAPPGAASRLVPIGTLLSEGWRAVALRGVWWPGALFGNGPHEPHQLTGAAEVTDGLVLDRRHRERRELPSPHEPGELDGITAVGCDPVPSRWGDYGGSDDPTGIALLAEIAIKP